jgi:NAD(P)-dependent dehydrogenase (short-subunit alcohol dehydrogenase family)
MAERLAGKTVVITGGTTGIGRAIALRFADEGAEILVSDIVEAPEWDAEDPRPTADVIESRGGTATYVHADVSKSEDVRALFQKAASLWPRIDVVVNNAARFDAYNILETSEEAWNRLIDVNLRGQYLVAKEALGIMVEQEIVNECRGRLINVSSQHGMIGPPDFFAYAVAKGGTVNMTHQLAVDFGRRHIYVNGLAPGRILTRHRNEDEAAAADPTIAYSRSRTPFHRLGRPSDLTGPALFLASDDCTYVSGINLLVDGGWMAY